MTVLHLQTSMATSLRLVINTYPKRKDHTVRDLNYQLNQLCIGNCQGGYATQVARRYRLNQIAG